LTLPMVARLAWRWQDSHGGGLVYEVAQELNDDYQFWAGKYEFSFAGYIDAIDRPGPFAQAARPAGVGYHMNYYQHIPNADVFAGTFIGAADVNHDFDAVVDSETHSSIDDEPTVHEDFSEVIDARLG
jgi:hypothetical protein